MQLEQFVSLIRERGAALLEVGHDRFRAIVDLAGPDQLVAGVIEGLQRDVELVAVLGLHVLAHDVLAALPDLRADGRALHRVDFIPESPAQTAC